MPVSGNSSRIVCAASSPSVECVGRHPDVDDHELGLVLAHELDQLVRVARLADDLEVGSLEQACEPLAEQDVVVGHDDADCGWSLALPRSSQPYAAAR